MKSIHGLALCLAALVWAMPAAAQDEAPYLSLHDALKTALLNAPSLGAAVERSASMKAAAQAAGVLANPEIAVEAENIGGTGPYKSAERAEYMYGVSQLIELPGKRSGRQSVAEGYERKSLYERDAVRLDLIRDVITAYAASASAQENLKILEDERVLASSIYEKVAAKVDAGKEPPIQKKKAAIALSASEIALERAGRSAQTANAVLANLMGGYSGAITPAVETMPAMKEPDGLAEYTHKMDISPDARIYDADVAVARSNLSLEKASAIPDPTINIGIRDFKEDGEQAFVAGVSFPLPVFDMNRAGIRKAGHDYNAAMKEKANARLNAQTRLIQTYELFVNAYREHQTLKEEVLLGAEDAFRIAQEGYRAGKFPYLDVLDTQRTLFETRKQVNQTMFDYYSAMAEIDRLTAIHAISQGDEK